MFILDLNFGFHHYNNGEIKRESGDLKYEVGITVFKPRRLKLIRTYDR